MSYNHNGKKKAATKVPPEKDAKQSGHYTAVKTDDQKEEDVEQRTGEELDSSPEELDAMPKVTDGIPPGVRWTKIDRRLVNPAALEIFHEEFEEREDYVVVHRVLTKEEIQALTVKTQEIRGESFYFAVRYTSCI